MIRPWWRGLGTSPRLNSIKLGNNQKIASHYDTVLHNITYRKKYKEFQAGPYMLCSHFIGVLFSKKSSEFTV
jgi:hypothetical protein